MRCEKQRNNGGDFIIQEPDYGKMKKEEINATICWILSKQISNEKKLNSLLISSILQSILLIILTVKLFLL